MAQRRLDPEERALWKRVTETVRPLAGAVDDGDKMVDTPPVRAAKRRDMGCKPPPSISEPVQSKKISGAQPPSDTLDGGWDRRLRRGMAAPDRTIDLHGHTLASAHGALERLLDDAVRDGARLLLVVTGKPPRASADGRPRGLIRAAIGDWLGGSRHAGNIAAVRSAHPRHGGAGALYVVLRRRR